VYAYNGIAYRFLVHKLSIKDIHPNTIIESRNVLFFEDVFSWKEAQEKHSLKRMIEASLSSYHQLKDDEVKLKKTKQEKMTKTFGPGFLTYLLENKPQTY